MQIYKIDANGFFIRDVIDDGGEIPADCVSIQPPQGLYRSKWDGATWVEGMTQEEIDVFLATKPEPKEQLYGTDQEFIRVSEDLIDILIAKGVIFLSDLPQEAQAKIMARKSLRENITE